MMKFVCLLACVAYVFADVANSRNQYLPPDKGYNYEKPNLPFAPSGQQPTQVPFPRTPQPQRPTPRPQQPSYPSGPAQDEHHHEPGMPFDFNYAVNDVESSNNYQHNAVSDGDVTRGEYRVAMPDGRTQIVKYTADWKNGYNAEVTYEGEARYPDPPQNVNNGGYKY